MIAAVVFYQSDDLFPSDSTMNMHLDRPAEQDDNNSRDLAQLLRRDHGSSELKVILFRKLHLFIDSPCNWRT